MDILLLFWSILIRIIPQIQKIIYLSSPFLPPVSQSSCRRFSLFSPDLSWLTKDGCYTIPKGTHMLVSNDSKRNTDCFRKGNTYENKKNIYYIILLVALYGSTVVFALSDSPNATYLFKASIFCTVIIPVILYSYVLVYRIFGHKKQDSPSNSEEASSKK